MAKKYLIENNSAIPSILFQESIPDGFSDFSSDTSLIDLHGTKVRDYLFVRNDINIILIPLCNPNYPTIDFSGWGDLTDHQREIMTKYILAPYALRLTILSDTEDYKNWSNLIKITQGIENNNNHFTGRSLLIEKMRRCVADLVRTEVFTIAASQDLFRDAFQLTQWYIGAACPDFKCWLTNEIGSNYEFDGFSQKNYYSEDLRDNLMLIYNGED